jgi:integrase
MPSGRWQASYVQNDTRYYAPTTFEKKSEGSSWLSEVETDIRRGKWIDPNDGTKTLAHWWQEWFDSPHLSRGTRKNYASLANHFLPYLGDKLLAKITPLQVHNLVKTWQTSGNVRTGGPLAPSTVQQALKLLRMVLGDAVEEDQLGRTPVRKMKLPPKPKRKVPHLSPEELAALFEDVPAGYRLVPWLGLVGPLRVGEITHLKVAHIDFPRRLLAVQEAKTGAGVRTIPLPESLVFRLAAHVAQLGLGPDDYLFPSVKGRSKPLPAGTWDDWWRQVRTKHGLPTLHFHDLRHLATSIMSDAGIDPKVASERLGHESTMFSLDVYGMTSPQAHAEAAKRLESLLGELISRKA